MPLDYETITGILTRERIRLINHLRETGPAGSLQELADALGRDKAAVSRDVSYLTGTFLEEERTGRTRRISAPKKPLIIY
jgi:predicted transcriptional regulator